MPKMNDGSNTSYELEDSNDRLTTTYYRVRSIDAEGDEIVSNKVKVDADSNPSDQIPAITIFPNPVRDQKLNITTQNLNAGTYQLQVSNELGQVLYTSTMDIVFQSTSQSFRLGNNMKPGVYQLMLQSPEGRKYTKQLIIR
jgi:hypothetical protein